jgi:hypothetical protein
MTGVLLLLLLGAAPDAPPPPPQKAGTAEVASRGLSLSIGADHAFASVRATVTPGDVGRSDWREFDRDRSGAVDLVELPELLKTVRGFALEYVCVAVDGAVLALGRRPAERESDGPVGLTDPLEIRVQGRLPLEAAGQHRFVIYDRPAEGSFVPVKLQVARGLRIDEAVGAFAEPKNDRRVQAVLRRHAPALWGTVTDLARPAAPATPPG